MTVTALARLAIAFTLVAGMAPGAMAQSSDEYQDEYQEDQSGGMMNQGMMPQQGMPQQRMPQQRAPEQRMPQQPGTPGMMSGRNMPDRMFAKMHRRGMPMLKVMFAIIDTDEDGSISFDEVTAVTKRIFDAIDTKNDGKITLEEIQAFLRN